MKIATYLAAAVLVAGVFSSCKKDGGSEEDPINPAYVQKAEQFKTFVQSKAFQIKDYYSNEPIDYIEDDEEIKQETDLWHYVSPWLRDDYNVFDVSTGKVTITQNAVKLDTIPDDIIIRDFSIGATKDGPYFNFLSYTYQPLRYFIHEIGSDYFVIYTDWHSGAKVFTRFETVTIPE